MIVSLALELGEPVCVVDVLLVGEQEGEREVEEEAEGQSMAVSQE